LSFDAAIATPSIAIPLGAYAGCSNVEDKDKTVAVTATVSDIIVKVTVKTNCIFNSEFQNESYLKLSLI
jgi:hypothetical protein